MTEGDLSFPLPPFCPPYPCHPMWTDLCSMHAPRYSHCHRVSVMACLTQRVAQFSTSCVSCATVFCEYGPGPLLWYRCPLSFSESCVAFQSSLLPSCSWLATLPPAAVSPELCALCLQVFEILLSRGYSENNFREDLKNLYLKLGIENKLMIFLFTDAHVAEEGFLELINNMLTSGTMVPALHPQLPTEAANQWEHL